MLQLEGICAAYGGRTVLHDISLSVAPGELISVLGPSGSGKTTLLRVIAGLETPTKGRILWDGQDLASVPVHERGFGLMFQDYALFPHRDVGANVAFGLRMRGDTAGVTEARTAEMVALVGLSGLERRSVSSLSGGERQRVALARALAPAPRVVMLDEPLGSLDRQLRERLPAELRRVLQEVGATVLYVTHDQEEALGIADRTVILNEGAIAAQGGPEELWARPPTPFVAGFLGFRNVATAIVADGLAHTPWGSLPIRAGEPGGEHWILLPPDAFAPDDGGPISGTVSGRLFRGDHVRLIVAVAEAPPLEIDARWHPLPQVGDQIRLAVDRGRTVLLAAATVPL